MAKPPFFVTDSPDPFPLQLSAGMPRASRNTCTIVPVVKTCTTVPVVGSTSAVASPHLDPGDSFDLLPQRVGGVAEQLPMKLLHLSGAVRGLGQGLLGRRQGPVQRDHQRVVAQDHGHRFGLVARSLLLESD